MTALGVYAGPNEKGVAAAQAFAASTCAPLAYRLDFAPYGTRRGLMGGLAYTLDAHAAGPPMGLDLAVGLLTTEDRKAGMTLGDVGAGANDEVWRVAGAQFAAHQRDRIVVRYAHEPGLPQYPWTLYGSTAADYVAAWRRGVSIVRETPGTDHVTFSWCMANYRNGWVPNPDAAYPGDDVVGEVAVDFYPYRYWLADLDEPPTKPDRDRVYSEITAGDVKTPAYSLDWWRQFATDHDQPFALGEWAPAIRSNGEATGDDPEFVHRVLTWCEVAGVARAGYFEGYGTSGGVDHRISNPDTAMPNAARAFRDRMSARVLQVPTSARTPRWAAA